MLFDITKCLSLFVWFDKFLDFQAEFLQFFCCICRKFNTLKFHSEMNWPLTQKPSARTSDNFSLFYWCIGSEIPQGFQRQLNFACRTKMAEVTGLLIFLISQWYLEVAKFFMNSKANTIGQWYFIALYDIFPTTQV